MSNAWMCFFLPSITFNDAHSTIKQVKRTRLWIKIWKFCFQGIDHCPSNQHVSMAQSLSLSKWYMVMSLVALLVAIGGSPSARVHQESDLLRAPNCRTVQSAIWASCLLLCSTCVLQLICLSESIWEPLWEALMGAGSARLCTIWRILTHCAQRCTLRTGEYSHGDRMEALPVPVVLRLNRGGRKSRRAICNCRCAAAPQASPLIIFPTGVLRLALKDEGAGFTGKRELSNWIWKVPRGFSSADGYNQILSMLVGNR